MCVIAYKPLNKAFPEERILQNCFENNDHGAGFMYTFNGEVHIHKGYETFEKFMEALNKARAITGDKVPYVMHFRIATQGYDKTMTHPFPLSSKMANLKRLHYKCSIGVAHNGILDITSDGAKTYSDTMKFITDYLSNIIQSMDFYKNKRTLKLIEYLIDGSRLAILDKNNHCTLMGKGWIKDNGIYYSNNSYAREPYYWPRGKAWWEDDGYYLRPALHSSGTVKKESAPAKEIRNEMEAEWDEYKNAKGEYFFDDEFCPAVVDSDESYCEKCINCTFCSTRAMNELSRKRAEAVEEVLSAKAAAVKAVSQAKQAASM
jgi:hypothetical protein